MIIVIKFEDTDNIIGMKEDIAMRLEGVANILHINVIDEKEKTYGTENNDSDRERI